MHAVSLEHLEKKIFSKSTCLNLPSFVLENNRSLCHYLLSACPWRLAWRRSLGLGASYQRNFLEESAMVFSAAEHRYFLLRHGCFLKRTGSSISHGHAASHMYAMQQRAPDPQYRSEASPFHFRTAVSRNRKIDQRRTNGQRLELWSQSRSR